MTQVIPMEGDLTHELLGVSEKHQQVLSSAEGILFLHCAADVQFDRPLNIAMNINVNGTYQCIQLAANSHAKAFLHISTLYVGSREQRNAKMLEVINEQGFDGNAIFHTWLNERNKCFDDKEIATLLEAKPKDREVRKWPNTYTFTKTIAEQVAVASCKKHNISLSIARLGIVSPAFREHAGWFMGSGGFGKAPPPAHSFYLYSFFVAI